MGLTSHVCGDKKRSNIHPGFSVCPGPEVAEALTLCISESTEHCSVQSQRTDFLSPCSSSVRLIPGAVSNWQQLA